MSGALLLERELIVPLYAAQFESLGGEEEGA